MPLVERQLWRWLFDFYGPLDWKRQDFLFARVCQFLSTSDNAFEDFLLFKDWTEEPTREERERALIERLGYRE